MEYFTAPGQGYVILTAGGTITSPDGTFSLTLDAGQTYFRATTDKIIVSDASATLCPVAKWPGMQPISVTILGEGTVSGDVPASYIVCSFLESTGDQIINTGLTLDSTSVIRSTSRTPATTAGQWEALYDTDYYMGAYYVNAQFCFIIYDENVNNICYSTYTTDTVYTIEQAYDSITINGEKLTYSDLGSGVVYDPTKPLCLFNRAGGSNPGKVRLMSLSVTTGGNKVGDYVPVLNEAGVPCMYDRVMRRPLYNEGESSFIVGMTAEQARLLSALPEGGGTLTISLPPDVVDENGVLQDMEIFTALSQAMAKGWNFILQTYDGTTVSTPLPLDYMECYFVQNTGQQQFILDHTDENLTGFSVTGRMVAYTAQYYACFSNYIGEAYTTTRIIPASETSSLVYLRHVAGNGIDYSGSLAQKFVISANNDSFVYNGEISSWRRPPSASTNTATLGVFSLHRGANAVTSNIFQVFSLVLTEASGDVCDLIPCITGGGEVVFFDKITKKTYLRDGEPAVAGMTAAQAVQLAKLPAGGGKLTVSLPDTIVSAAGDVLNEEVAAAIETANDNGWTITVQSYIADDLSDVGGGDYIRANFLEATGTQCIYTNVRVTNNTGCAIGYTKSGQPGQEMYLVCIRSLANGFGTNNWWSPPIPYFRDSGMSWQICFGPSYIIPADGQIPLNTRFDVLHNYKNSSNAQINGETVLTFDRSLYTEDNYPENPLVLFGFVNAQHTPWISALWQGKVYYCYMTEDAQETRHYNPAITPEGVPCMYDGVTKQPFYNGGTGAFIVGLTASQALNLANLPEKTASLTISLPASIVSGSTITDAQVASAIETARSKGWTITVRTYTE